jgi:hypothetical protein
MKTCNAMFQTEIEAAEKELVRAIKASEAELSVGFEFTFIDVETLEMLRKEIIEARGNYEDLIFAHCYNIDAESLALGGRAGNLCCTMKVMIELGTEDS